MTVEDGVMEQLDQETSDQLTKELDPMATGIPDEGEHSEFAAVTDDTPADAKEEEKPPVLDDATVNAAQELGLDVEALGVDAVKSIVSNAEKLAFNRFRNMLPQQEPQQAPEQQEPQQPPLQRNDLGQFVGRQQQSETPQTPAAQQGQEPEPIPEFKIELDPEAYDEDIVKTLNGMAEHFTKVTQSYQSRLDNLTGLLQSQQEEATEHRFLDAPGWFDEALQTAGDESVFGKGPIDRLPTNGELSQNRVDLNEVYQQVLAFKGIDDPFTKDDELLRLAIDWYQSDKASNQQQQQQQLSQNVSERSRKTIGRPSTRPSSATSADYEGIDPESGYPAHVIADLQRQIKEMTG